jgi:hypothetical protein
MYAAWQALKPVWFTDAVQAQIPDAFIPTEGCDERTRVHG